MKHRLLFIGMRFFVRPWVAPFKPVWLIKSSVLFLDFILGFLAVIGFKKIKISDKLNADSIVLNTLGDRPVILYLHGGAFACHLPNAYRSMARKLSIMCNVDIIIPDYRLAPKNKFPAGLNDCIASYQYLLENGVSSQNIAICGDSAGGNLTFATLIELARKNIPVPACAVTISPVVDANGKTESVSNCDATEFYFSSKTIKAVQNCYLSDTDCINDPRISPIKADVSVFPPVLIQASVGEMLEDDANNMHDAILKAGGVSQIRMWHDVPHVFHMIAGLPEAREAFADISIFVNSHWKRQNCAQQ